MAGPVKRSFSVGGVTLSIEDDPKNESPYVVTTDTKTYAPEDLKKPTSDNSYENSRVKLWLMSILQEYKIGKDLFVPKPSFRVRSRQFVFKDGELTLEESESLARLLQMEVDYLKSLEKESPSLSSQLAHGLFRDY